jgi:hypothetical protein
VAAEVAISISVHDGRIDRIHGVGNPAELTHLQR